jgi:hypothetical protein
MPAQREAGAAAAISDVGRHFATGTRPGSTMSRPSKKPRISSRDRIARFSADSVSSIAAARLACGFMSPAGWEMTR